MDFIYGRLTKQLKLVEYTGLITDTAQTVVNNDDSNTIAVNVVDAIINNKSLKNSILPDIYSRLDEGSSDISSLEERVDAIEANYVTTDTRQDITAWKVFGTSQNAQDFNGVKITNSYVDARQREYQVGTQLNPRGFSIYNDQANTEVQFQIDRIINYFSEDSEASINYPKIGGTFAIQSNSDRSYDLKDYVTTDTDQEITGEKTFVGMSDFQLKIESTGLVMSSQITNNWASLGAGGLTIAKYNEDVGINFYRNRVVNWVTEDSEVAINYPQIGGTFAVQSNNSKSYDLNDYVTLANQQTITGTKSFSAGTTVFGGTYNAVTGTHIQNGSIWFRTGDNFSYKGISTPENKISFFKSFNVNDARSAYIDFNTFTSNASVSLSYQSDSTKSANLNDYSTLTDLSEATSLSTTVAIDTLFA